MHMHAEKYLNSVCNIKKRELCMDDKTFFSWKCIVWYYTANISVPRTNKTQCTSPVKNKKSSRCGVSTHQLFFLLREFHVSLNVIMEWYLLECSCRT